MASEGEAAMSDISQGPGWWRASDGKWYPPESHPDARAAAAATVPAPVPVGSAAQVVASETLLAPDSAPDNKRRVPRWLPLGAVALVVGVGLVVLLSSVFGSGNAAGADSPDAAFDGIMAALDTEDGLGLVSLVDLDDFGLLADALDGGSGEGALSEGLPGGIDFHVTGLDGGAVTATYRPLGGPDAGLMVAQLGGLEITLARTDEDAAAVVLFDEAMLQVFSTGEVDPGSEIVVEMRPRGRGFDVLASGRFNGERLPAEDFSSDDVPLELVFIENDGRWFFSLGYTIANLAVQAGVVGEPDYGAWRRVVADDSAGGDTPSEAIARVVNAAPELDLEEAMQAVDPVETKLLHDFLPLILDEIDDPRADALREGRLEIVELELTEEIDGDTAMVFIDLIAIRGSEDGGDSVYLELDGDWCYRIEGDFNEQSGCLDRDLGDLQDAFDEQFRQVGLGTELDLRELLPERPFLVTSRHEGNWYFSPLGTVFSYSTDIDGLLDNALGQLQRGQLAAGSGTLMVDSIPFDSGATVEVPANSSRGLAFAVGPDDFNDADGFELSMAAVTFSTTGSIEVQHNVERFFEDEVRNTVRVRASKPTTLLVSSEPGFPRSSAVVMHNGSDESITVSVTVTRLPFEALQSGDSISGVIDDVGTPWLLSTSATVEVGGANLTALEFERFPWFEIGRGDSDGNGILLVVGEPGTAFTLDAS